MYYGFVPRSISYTKPVAPIDALINHADAYYIDWNLANPKFIDVFRTFYKDWATREGSVAEMLIIDLEDALNRQSQPSGLVDKLIKFTLASRSAELDSLEIDFEDGDI